MALLGRSDDLVTCLDDAGYDKYWRWLAEHGLDLRDVLSRQGVDPSRPGLRRPGHARTEEGSREVLLQGAVPDESSGATGGLIMVEGSPGPLRAVLWNRRAKAWACSPDIAARSLYDDRNLDR